MLQRMRNVYDQNHLVPRAPRFFVPWPKETGALKTRMDKWILGLEKSHL